MEYRKLGRSDLKISAISLGSWLTFSGGVEREHAEACVRTARELGINFFDTANVYGRGASETFLGEVLKSAPRDSYFIATKLYFPMSDTDFGLSRAQIFKQIDASLQRLQVDYVDLYQCHRYDEETPLAETMEALTKIVRDGKARYIGFSEWPVEKVREAQQMLDVEPFVSSQPQYSLLWRKPEAELIPYCQKVGIGQIVFSPLRQGVLTGKYKPGQPLPADSRAANPKMNAFLGADRRPEKDLAAVEQLGEIAKELGLSTAQLALAWVLNQPNVASAIIGASRPEQIKENLGAVGHNLSPDVLARLDKLFPSH